MADEIDPKEHERLETSLRMLLYEAKALIAESYWEASPAHHVEIVVPTNPFLALVDIVDQILMESGQPPTLTPPFKRAPSLAMREALEWILQPDHAIGSDAEMRRKSEEKAREALGVGR